MALSIEQALELAVGHHRAGRFREAYPLYQEVLAAMPGHHGAMHMLGMMMGQGGRVAEGVELMKRSIGLCPTEASYHSNLGKFLVDMGRMAEAEMCAQEAVRLAPGVAEGWNNLGNVLQCLGRAEEAAGALRKAIELKPEYAEAHGNLGNVFAGQRRWEEAIASYQEGLRHRANFAAIHFNLGNALAETGQRENAAACYREALRIVPGYVEAMNNLGNVVRESGEADAAIGHYLEVLRLRPDFPGARNNLGNALKDAGRLDAAIASYREAVRLRPGDIEAHSNLVYTLHFHAGGDTDAIREEQRQWSHVHAEPLKSKITAPANNRNPERRLRIGYVSPDFRDHCQSFFTIPLLTHHDREHFEATCYADVRYETKSTRRLRNASARWRDISQMNDEQVAEQVRSDGIDILVDLTMHMARGRLRVFARKPAPVQVTWLAYPGTTGLESMDYRLTDPFLDPPGGDERAYSEISVRLPETFWCYDPLTDEPPVNELPATVRGIVTFGCLNNFCKVHDGVLRLWAQVLQAVEGSRLLVLAPPGRHRADAITLMQRQGVEAGRIEFVPFQARKDYLKMYHRIDIALDTFPVNGHTTSLDALWMGVPVVTLAGSTAMGRAGISQLMNLGLPELIGRTPEEYVRIAAGLAGDIGRMEELRRTMRIIMEKSALMDGIRFARNMEEAYREMWRRWCGPSSPDGR